VGFQKRFKESLAAGAESDINLKPMDRFPRPGRVTVYAVRTAGATTTAVASLFIGTDIITDQGPVNPAVALSRVIIPDDFHSQGVGVFNDPVTLRVKNDGSATTIVDGIVVYD